jgi:hypothetical protein
MLISGNEKYKVESIIREIEDGTFNQTDVDNLFMKLRAFSSSFPKFTEIAHFLAHNDERSKGITVELLRAVQVAMTFQEEYVVGKKELLLDQPFPIYIKKHILNQVTLCDDRDFDWHYALSKEQFRERVNRLFLEDKSTNTARLVGTINGQEQILLSFLLGSFFPRELFTQNQIINDLIAVMKYNQLNFDESKIGRRGNEITLCIMAILHNTLYKLGDSKRGKCSINTEWQEKIALEYLEKGKDRSVVLPKEDWGTLAVWGLVPSLNPKRDLKLCFRLLTSSLRAEDYCDESMFEIYREGEREDERMTLHQYLRFDADLTVNKKFKLVRLIT